MKLLVCGDLHIGRASSRVCDSIGREQIWTVCAWHAVVDLAIAEKVDLLCLTGDVVDHGNRYWEAIGPLEQGITKLAASGIRTLAVAGNHDYEVLPRLANSLDTSLCDHFTLLGQGGIWQRETIWRGGHPVLHVDGWSFPTRYVDRSPLDDYAPPAADELPVLGMVHGDLDDPNSRYAPLSLAQLRRTRADAWLLGHVHTSRIEEEPGLACILYPGSPQAMDPGEPGMHGAWIVQVASTGATVSEMKPLSSVYYHSMTMDLDHVDGESAFQSMLIERVRDEAARLVEVSGDHLLAISVRLMLVGRTALSHRLPGLCAELVGDLELTVGVVRVGVEKVLNRTAPPVDLAAHAKGTTAVSVLAQLLLDLDLDEPSKELSELIVQAEQKIRGARHRGDFVGMPEADDAHSVRDIVKEQVTALLGELLEQAR